MGQCEKLKAKSSSRTPEGIVFDVQRFSIHDGPGIRTTVFMMGCPLRCIWCHNPESLMPEGWVSYDEKQCILCGKCVDACPRNAWKLRRGKVLLDRNLCERCGSCVRACPSGAIRAVGRRVEVDELLAEIVKDRLFYENSGGGITVSGGEPLKQWEFVAALLRRSKSVGIHTALDTCGYASKEVLQFVARYTDLFLFDLKHPDREEHKRATGVSNDIIIQNLRFLDRKNIDICVRIPVIPEFNDREGVFQEFARLLGGLKNVRRAELLSYHPLGQAKYQQLGLEYRFDALFHSISSLKMEALARTLRSKWGGEVIVRK